MQLDQLFLERISKEAGVQPTQVSATIALLEDEATIPFIARYRKEATGNLDEVRIRTISEKHEYYKELLSRRETILKTIEEQGRLTQELKSQILSCYEKNELEDLYLPFKPKRKTKASVALEKGLEPLARLVWGQVPGEKSIEELAETLIDPEKGVASKEEAFDGALHIIAEWISEDTEIRRGVRQMMFQEGIVVSKVVKDKEGQKTKYDMYYDFREPVSKIPSHRMLAIRRGVKEQVLTFTIEIDSEKAWRLVSTRVIKDPQSSFAAHLGAAVKDSYERLLNPSIQSEVRAFLKGRSDSEAIKVFEANLSNLLLAAPAGPIVVMGVDPGFRTGCKVAVIDATGKLLEHATIYPTEPRKDIAGAEDGLYRLVQKHKVRAIAIGNGTACRETDSFVKDFLGRYQRGESFELPQADRPSQVNISSIQDDVAQPPGESVVAAGELGADLPLAEGSGILPHAEIAAKSSASVNVAVAVLDQTTPLESLELPLWREMPTQSSQDLAFTPGETRSEERHPVFSIIVNESGASVYSASEGARREFPKLDVTVRGAISIARRLQDPLAELVKIHPKSVGVGQYQHDVDQKRLKQGLEAAVESCVNQVGVDLNTASGELLRYVSGLNQRAGKALVEYRHEHGRFTSRSQLLQVLSFGEKTYEHAAGFLRIRGGENPLDATAVHPESYVVVERMARSLGLQTADLIGNGKVLESFSLEPFIDEKIGLYTLNDIKQELLKPGRDPRDQFVVPSFRDDVKEVSDLRVNMVLEGTVTNVTNFGAFVDIGVHQDGLVHISELSNRFVQDPREAVHVGEVVKVKVIGVDHEMKRISLSIRALLPKLKKNRPARTTRRPERAHAAVVADGASKPSEKPSGSVSKAQAKTTAPRKQVQTSKPHKPRQKEPAKVEVRQEAKREKESKKPEPSRQPDLSFAEKIRLLQEKFGGIR